MMLTTPVGADLAGQFGGTVTQQEFLTQFATGGEEELSVRRARAPAVTQCEQRTCFHSRC